MTHTQPLHVISTDGDWPVGNEQLTDAHDNAYWIDSGTIGIFDLQDKRDVDVSIYNHCHVVNVQDPESIRFCEQDNRIYFD